MYNEVEKFKFGGVSIYCRDSESRNGIVNLQALYRALTQSDIVVGELPTGAELPSSTTPENKIYRVPGTTSYSDYMWDGTQFVLMATYDNAIDTEPKLYSNNIITSNAIAENFRELKPIKVGFSMVNGSQGNPANEYVVTLKGANTLAIPVDQGDTITVNINKTLPEGFHYYYRLVTYNTENPSALYGEDFHTIGIKRDWASTGTPKPITEPIDIRVLEKGITIQITALTSEEGEQNTEDCTALRVSDFQDGDIEIVRNSGGIEDIWNALKDLYPCIYRSNVEYTVPKSKMYVGSLQGDYQYTGKPAE